MTLLVSSRTFENALHAYMSNIVGEYHYYYILLSGKQDFNAKKLHFGELL